MNGAKKRAVAGKQSCGVPSITFAIIQVPDPQQPNSHSLIVFLTIAYPSNSKGTVSNNSSWTANVPYLHFSAVYKALCIVYEQCSPPSSPLIHISAALLSSSKPNSMMLGKDRKANYFVNPPKAPRAELLGVQSPEPFRSQFALHFKFNCPITTFPLIQALAGVSGLNHFWLDVSGHKICKEQNSVVFQNVEKCEISYRLTDIMQWKRRRSYQMQSVCSTRDPDRWEVFGSPCAQRTSQNTHITLCQRDKVFPQ